MKIQWPIDGKPGKAWRVTSPMGWRIHPIKKTKKHHNGADIGGTAKIYYIEAFADGVVLAAGPSKLRKRDGSVGGFGYFVQLRHKIDGKDYTSCYAHMKPGSIKVKKGQRVTAGTVLGVMGTSGESTGRHLHWEIYRGKKHGWSADGRGFVNPIAFVKALLAKQAVEADAPKPTPVNAPATPLPPHSTPVVTPTPAKPVAKPLPTLRVGSKGSAVKTLQKKLGVTVDGSFGPKTKAAVVAFQKKHRLTPDGVVGPLTWSKLK